MPRLIIRKSALSTTHYCRRWFPGNPAKTQRRKANDGCFSAASTDIPRRNDSRHLPVEDVGRGRAGCETGRVAVGGAGTKLIRAGGRIVLNICRWLRRSRCALLAFLLLFFTLTFFKLTSDGESYDADVDTLDPAGESDPRPANYVDEVPLHDPATAVNYRLARPNCNALEDGDEGEIRRIEDMLYKETRMAIPNSYFQASTLNCSMFRRLRNYAAIPYSGEELETPLAYVIAVKQSAEQVERLLRAVYTPQNVYCLYGLSPADVDFEGSELGEAIKRIAGCFTNVFLAPLRHDADPKDSAAAPYRSCLEALLAYYTWSYALLASEGDFPLKTNHEIVERVKHAVAAWRATRTNESRRLPPLGAVNDFSGFVLTRRMAQFVVSRLKKPHDDDRSRPTGLAMQARPDNPAAFTHLKIRLDNFCPDGKQCSLTSSDLHWLLHQPFPFARKFDLRMDYVVIACIENRLQILNAVNQKVLPIGGT